MLDSYSPEIAQDIFHAFRAKGWNMYLINHLFAKPDIAEAIRTNLVKSLEINKEYVLYP